MSDEAQGLMGHCAALPTGTFHKDQILQIKGNKSLVKE